MRFRLGVRLRDVSVNQTSNGTTYVSSCEITTNAGNADTVTADTYVVCIDPYEAAAVTKTALTTFPENGAGALAKLARLAESPPHVQISFRMVVRDGAGIGLGPVTVLTFPDSEFNITVCPQEHFFDDSVLQSRRIWSGTACITDRVGKLFGKPAALLSKQEFEAEVVYQVTRSRELGLDPADVLDFEIWKDWSFPPDVRVATSKYSKWVTNLDTSENRPSQRTGIFNLFLGGAHTRTSTDFWSMEGAVESGKLAAAAITSNHVPLFTHEPPPVFRALGAVDNLLYAGHLPNVVDMLLLMLVVLFLLLVNRTGKNVWQKNGDTPAPTPRET